MPFVHLRIGHTNACVALVTSTAHFISITATKEWRDIRDRLGREEF